jgi:23S rRNA (adenine2030-N6)-methyltransferase
MNYRHAFHAGNFGDVVKHAVVALLVRRLQEKEAAFRVIDTHAGIGTYDLARRDAPALPEWENGIGRQWGRALSPALADSLGPDLAAVAALNGPGPLRRYPGSPWLVRHLLRRQDRLTAVELHPDDAQTLANNFAGDVQVRTVALDGWLALGAFLPPKERRGLVLVDPPYEQRDEFRRMLEAFGKAHHRWAGGQYALWYPVKDRVAVNWFRKALAESGIRKLLRFELMVRSRDAPDRLNGTGMVLCNPPWGFRETLGTLLPALVPLLAQEAGAGHIIDQISGE